nr:hypothetical protein [uncultured Draconibacterium sp.]
MNSSSEYISYNKNELLDEIQDRSNIFVLTSNYDHKKDILTCKVNYWAVRLLISYITLTIFIIIFWSVRFIWGEEIKIFLSHYVTDHFYPSNLVLLLIDNIFILAFTIWTILSIPDIILLSFLTKHFNKIKLDFKNKRLSISNIDYLARYFSQTQTVDFGEIKRIYTKDFFKSIGIFKRSITLLKVETSQGKEITLLPIIKSRFQDINHRRLTDIIEDLIKITIYNKL